MKECRDLFNPPFFWGVMIMNKKSDDDLCDSYPPIQGFIIALHKTPPIGPANAIIVYEINI